MTQLPCRQQVHLFSVDSIPVSVNSIPVSMKTIDVSLNSISLVIASYEENNKRNKVKEEEMPEKREVTNLHQQHT